jgi:hypothetical protein
MTWLVDVLLHAPWSRGEADWFVALTVLSMTLAYSLPIFLKHILDEYVPRSFLHSFYYAALTLGTVIFTSSVTSDFIYFQF